MNTANFQQIVDHYVERFDELNNSDHQEYYKWLIAQKFRPMMDDALAAANSDFPKKLIEVVRLTENMIDSYTQPFGGLVAFAGREPGTVREMFLELFSFSEAPVKEKEEAIWRFLGKSHGLRAKYSSGSFRYKDDLHSVTGYLFLYDPEHNYLYKPTHCREFADCLEFYEDWGSGADTKLDVFFRMCDETVALIKKNEALLKMDPIRRGLSPEEMHPDCEKHIQLFDLIYCCSTYNLFHGIHYVTPKSSERKDIYEKKETAKQLAATLAKAKEDLTLLNQAKDYLKECLKPGVSILHKSFGEGAVVEANKGILLINFSDLGTKKLGLLHCVSNDLIALKDKVDQQKLIECRDILKKDEQIRNGVSRAENALEPYIEYLN